MRHEGSWIALKDDVSRNEARAAVSAVVNHLEDRNWSGYSVSVGKWRSEDAQGDEDVRCVYSVNVESWSRVYGRSWCVSEQWEERDGMEWVITLRFSKQISVSA